MSGTEGERPNPDPAVELMEGVDYYLDPTGMLVFTAKYLAQRGFCCGNGCRHCPYGHKAVRRTEG